MTAHLPSTGPAYASSFLLAALNKNVSTELIDDEADWEKILQDAEWHGIEPLILRSLENAQASSLPAEVWLKLNHAAQENGMRNLMMTGELWKILQAFGAHNIAAIPFKGPTIAALAYDDLALRNFGDLDILIHPDDLERAGQVLKNFGYDPEMEIKARHRKTFLYIFHALSFIHQNSGLTIELHWKLAPPLLPFDLNVDRIAHRLSPAMPGGKPMRTFPLEELLLYLCAHGTRHWWMRLGWVGDLDGLIRRQPNLDWNYLLKLSCELKNERSFLLGLELSRKILNTPLPLSILARLEKDSGVKKLAVKILQVSLQPEKNPFGLWAQHYFYWQLYQKPLDKAKYLYRLIAQPNPSDWEFISSLPPSLSPLYALLRPFRLMRSAWLRWQRSKENL